MPSRIALTVQSGPLTGHEYRFEERTSCLLGRAEDCSLRLPDDEQHRQVSRHHCLLDINPPDIRVRDLGSLNGTFVNGKLIGQRRAGQTPEEGAQLVLREHDLRDDDLFAVGPTVFRVRVHTPAVCAGCSREIPEEQQSRSERAPGIHQCDTCRRTAERDGRKQPPQRKPKLCSRCGRNVDREVGELRAGEYVCADCRKDVSQVIRHMLNAARQGERDLSPIQDYDLIKELGRGGFGAVYLAERRATGQRVALKVMLPQVAMDEHTKDLFIRETENTKALKHRNIVQLLDSGCSRGTFFFTLEFCDGGSVDKLIERRGGRIPVSEAVTIVWQALDGLEYAHNAEIPHVRLGDGRFGRGRGLVHRDLKPQNIFLSGSGSARVAKIGDYGLAKAFDTAGLSGQTRTGSVMGTPVFMPRQQAINFKFAKPEVDVWAMAASLYTMLTGELPRDFPRDRDVWQVVLQSDPVPIRQRDPSIPSQLADVIDLALRDRPELRFKSAADLKRALESAL